MNDGTDDNLAKPGAGWSVGSLAEEFELDRRTASRLVKGVPPSGEWRGHATYRIAEVAPAFVAYRADAGRRARGVEASAYDAGGRVVDPDALHPKDRKDWYDSELKRLQLELQQGRLAEAEAVRELLAEVFGRVKSWASTIADRLERDASLTPEQTGAVVDSSDRLLDELHGRLTNEIVVDASPDAERDAPD